MTVPAERTDAAPAPDLEAQLKRRLDQIDALGRVAHALTGVEDAQRTMQYLAAEGMRVFGAERAAVYLYERKRGRFECVVSLGLSARYVGSVSRRFQELPAVRSTVKGEPHFINDVRTEPEYPLREDAEVEGFLAVASLPLVFGGESMGALTFYHDAPRAYSEDERRLAIAFADQAALAIGKSRLLEQVSRIKREWQSAFDSIGSGLAITESTGLITRGNRFIAELAQVPVTALPGVEIQTLFAAWPQAGRDPLLEALATNARISTQLDSRDGRHLVLTATPRPEGGLVVAVDDLTELVRLEERFSRVVQTAHDAILIAGLDGKVSFANDAAVTLFARPLWGLLGTPISSLLPPEGAAVIPVQPQDEGAPRRHESLMRRDDGARRLAVSSAPLDEGGKRTGTVIIARDVTQEREAEEALRRSEARFRALFAAAPLAIFTIDAEHRFQSVNRAAVDMVGLAGREPGRGVRDFLLPAEAEYVGGHLRASFRGETRDFIFHFRRADGAVREAAAISVPVEEAGRVPAVLAIARDVTEEMQLRERLTHSEKMAALGALVSGVAHELNNPLAGIAALAQALALDPGTDEESARISQTIRREAVRAARIVSDLLTFARQRPLRREQTDLNMVVREALESCPTCHEEGVRWDLALAPDLPLVNADSEQVRQVITNLVTNASQAMREGRRRVGTVRTYGNEEVVGCEVSDCGPGIAPEVIQRIFEPFFTTKGVGEGTGLGLSISHGIIRAHGGDIQVQNRAEGGARFWFELPRRTSRGTRVTDG